MVMGPGDIWITDPGYTAPAPDSRNRGRSSGAPSFEQPTYDFFNRSALNSIGEGSAPANEFRELWRRGGIGAWEIEIRDLSGGIGAVGDFNALSHKVRGESSGTPLDCRWPGSLHLLISRETDATPDPTGGDRLSSLQIFDVFALAQGSGANVSLMIETSVSDYTPSVRTYSPGSNITALAPIVIGGATSAIRLAVCRAGAVVEILSDLASTPTSAGSMHADTSPCWGINTSPIDGTLLIYADNNIYTLAKTAAIGDAPGVATANVPDGGAALGVLEIGNAPIRAYWAFPEEDQGTTVSSSQDIGYRVFSTNLEGTDLQELDMGLIPFPGYADTTWYNYAPYQNGLLGSDGRSITWHTGTLNVLPWPGDRLGLAANGALFCGGFFVHKERLVLLVVQSNIFIGSALTSYWLEEFDVASGQSYQISPIVTDASASGTFVGSHSMGSYPVSPSIGVLHYYDGDQTWSRSRLIDSNRNPFYHWQSTGSNTAVSFESAGTTTSCEMYLPRGYARYPSVVSEIEMGGDPASGGATTTVEVEIATQGASSMSFTGNPSAVFSGADRWDSLIRKFPGNSDVWNRLQYRIVATRGSDDDLTPQCLPIIIRGYTFFDRQVRTPMQIEPVKYK